MYRAVLVDDEKWILESLKSTVDWKAQGFEIAGEAMNGIEARTLIERMRPDVAFVDIRMPGMNGIELIGSLKDAGLPTQFVIASGYAEFEYARKALAYGAAGYCLKPFRKEEVEDVLAAVKARLAKDEQAAHDEWVTLLSEIDSVEKTRLESILRRLGLDWEEAGGACILVLHGEDTGWVSRQWTSVSMRIGRGKTAFILPAKDRPQVLERLESGLPAEIRSAGISDAFLDIGRIWEHIDSANLASYRFFTSRGARWGAAGEHAEKLDPSVLHQVAEGLKRSDLKSVLLGFDSLKAQFGSGKYDIRHASQLYDIVWTYLDVPDGAGESLLPDFDKLTSLYGHVDDMFASLEQLVRSGAGEQTPAAAAARHDIHFRNILTYIDEHLHDDLSIQDISKQWFIHPNYLSSLFRKTLGITFSKYLTDKRLNRACELLRTTDLAVSEVAERSGYRDYFYFARLFKKQIGCTPSEYRNEARPE